MNMGGNNDPIFNENDEGLEQDVAHPESGDTNVENFNNVNCNSPVQALSINAPAPSLGLVLYGTGYVIHHPTTPPHHPTHKLLA